MFGGGDAGRRSLGSGRVECEVQVALGVQHCQGNEMGKIRVPVFVQTQRGAVEGQGLECQVGLRAAAVAVGC